MENYETQNRSQKNMSNSLKTIVFVHWASIDCKGGLSLIESRCKK